MKIERGTAHTSYEYYTVLVDRNELVTASGRPLPYSTWIGTFRPNGKINVWTPAVVAPRGYREAATRMLEQAAATHAKYFPLAVGRSLPAKEPVK